MNNTLDGVINFLIENGMDEEEINHFLYKKQPNNKTLMNMIINKDWTNVWVYINQFIFGDILVNYN